MSKYAESVDFSEGIKSEADKKNEQLRHIERQFKWKADDWHFRLAQEMDEPIKVYAWFREAKKIGDIIYFNSKSKMGNKPFDWVRENYIGHLLKAFGKIEIRLAKEGVVLKSFNPAEKFNKRGEVAKILGVTI